MNYTIKQSKHNDVINDDNLAKDRPPRGGCSARSWGRGNRDRGSWS